MDLPSSFWEYMIRKWLNDAPVFPISQVFGFTQYTANAATKINTTEATSSGSYTDLATAGPSLTNLPDGNYLILLGCQMTCSFAGAGAFMSFSVNGTTASDNDGCATGDDNFSSVSVASIKALSNKGSNTLTAKYRAGTGTATFATRWLIALRYSNL